MERKEGGWLEGREDGGAGGRRGDVRIRGWTEGVERLDKEKMEEIEEWM